jgi:hypothetical protein
MTHAIPQLFALFVGVLCVAACIPHRSPKWSYLPAAYHGATQAGAKQALNLRTAPIVRISEKHDEPVQGGVVCRPGICTNAAPVSGIACGGHPPCLPPSSYTRRS